MKLEEQHRLNNANRFAALENLDDNVDIERAEEVLRKV
jgi:hypothetical protein